MTVLKLLLQKLKQAAESSTELLVSDGEGSHKDNWSTEAAEAQNAMLIVLSLV